MSVRRAMVRWCGALLLTALGVAVWLQRATVFDAVGQMRSMSAAAIGALVMLAGFERVVRADIVRTLMNRRGPGRSATLSFGAALTVHDVGTAASKALPLGGAVGTALRWSMSRAGGVTAPRFTSVFVAYGAASTFVAWSLPLVFLVVDVGQGFGDRNDWLLIGGISLVLATSLGVMAAMLRSDRAERWFGERLGRLAGRLRRPPIAETTTVATSATSVGIVRAELRRSATAPWRLLLSTAAAQCSGALILFISLRSLGVGDELGVIEFGRVYFVAQLLGSFIPTPGGIGVVEAGLTGALVAAGVDVRLALASVLVYRLITYVLPIVIGFVLYVRWRVGAARIEPVDGELVDAEMIEFEPVPLVEPVTVGSALELAVAS